MTERAIGRQYIFWNKNIRNNRALIEIDIEIIRSIFTYICLYRETYARSIIFLVY